MIKNVTPSEKVKLRKRLRKLDKELSRFSDIDRIVAIWGTNAGYIRMQKLDQKRKEVRNKLK